MELEKPNMVEIRIPCHAEFVGVTRLAILGVASRMRFSYDEVEDIRLAVGEACANAIERSKLCEEPSEFIQVHCIVEEKKLTVEVTDLNKKPLEKRTLEGTPDEQSLGTLLMGLLVDEVETLPIEGGGTCIRMVKYVERQ